MSLPLRFHTCRQCSTLFLPVPCSKGLYCSLSCVHASQRKPREVRNCLACGKQYQKAFAYEAGPYCCRKCSNAHKQGPKRMEDRPCPFCGETFTLHVHRNNPPTPCCSRLCSKRFRALTVVGTNHPLFKPKIPMACEVCGTIKEVKPSLVSRFRACSRRCASILGQMTWPRISSIERKIDEAFRSIGQTPEAQYLVGPYILDFAFPDHRLAVECDGTYWHGRPEQQFKDRRKDGYLKHKGWKCIRLTEVEINADPADCVMRVLKLLETRRGIPPRTAVSGYQVQNPG